jgi:hypothetical protein
MRKIILSLFLTSLFTLSACSQGTPEVTPEGDLPTYSGIDREALGIYHATFLMQFEGEFNWSYRLDMRSDGTAEEYLLHLEGLSPAQNPGDIRMVSQGGVNRMRGPGTEGECVQFSSDVVLGPVFFTPDDLIPPQAIAPYLNQRDAGRVAGVASDHYSLNQVGLANWRDLEIDLWHDPISGAVLKFDITATGSDPLFDAGEGKLTGRYVVNAFGPQTIDPVRGCEIDLPIPADNTGLMKLPGLIAFESPTSLEEAVGFYQRELSAAGWEVAEEPLEGPNAIVLSYRREGETLEINLEETPRGVTVELLIDR